MQESYLGQPNNFFRYNALTSIRPYLAAKEKEIYKGRLHKIFVWAGEERPAGVHGGRYDSQDNQHHGLQVRFHEGVLHSHQVRLTDASVKKPCTATAIPFIYLFSGNSAASAPISTFMCLWAIYIFPGSVHIFPPAEKAEPSWEYIIRSQTHECGNWDWGPDIPFLGIFV